MFHASSHHLWMCSCFCYSLSLGSFSRNFGGNSLSPPTLSPPDVHVLGISDYQTATCIQSPLSYQVYVCYLKTSKYTAEGAANCSYLSLKRCFMGISYAELTKVHKPMLKFPFSKNNMHRTGKISSLTSWLLWNFFGFWHGYAIPWKNFRKSHCFPIMS
jgi:hypothetical protein